MKRTARIELYLMVGEIYGAAIDCLAELLPAPEWKVDRDGDEITLDGEGVNISIHDAMPSPLGPAVLVSGRFGLDRDGVEQVLHGIGQRLQAAGLLYTFQFDNADGGDARGHRHPRFPSSVC
jgi:hypothetical protein